VSSVRAPCSKVTVTTSCAPSVPLIEAST
jgi:hypothetical protein